MIQVAELWRYPIKSCAGEQLFTASISETGIEHDRDFMLVRAEDNSFITQRLPGMERLAAVQVHAGAAALRVSADGFGYQEIPVTPSADTLPVATAVHGKPCHGLELPDGSAFFSRLLDVPVRLLKADERQPRYLSEPYQRDNAVNRVAFGDGFPFLLTSRASLRALHRMAGSPYGTVPMNRFRPNIVIDGAELAAFAEDYWLQLRIGPLAAFVVRACDRCSIPSIIQRGETAGQKGDIAVKAQFLKSRAGIDLAAPDQPKGRFFGQNLNHALTSVGGLLRVGQQLEVVMAGGANVALRSV